MCLTHLLPNRVVLIRFSLLVLVSWWFLFILIFFGRRGVGGSGHYFIFALGIWLSRVTPLHFATTFRYLAIVFGLRLVIASFFYATPFSFLVSEDWFLT